MLFNGLAFEETGTRFRLYPQSPVLDEFAEPETVWVSTAPWEIEPGPADLRMYVVDAVGKEEPYAFPALPPWQGRRHPEVPAGSDGHFDHLAANSREFRAAHMYGVTRMVLDIWEGYFQRPIDWHFQDVLPRLELIPWLQWNNAQAGFGFIETGYRLGPGGERVPLSLNFDVLAHELGHSILYSELGLPTDGEASAEYVAYHESASDLVAIISVLHFDSIVDLLLERTHGNLYVRNFLNRIGETSPTEQLRLASNRLRMRDVPDRATPLAALSQRQRHLLGEPVTGAVFDILVEVFQQMLVDEGLISEHLDASSRRDACSHRLGPSQAGFDRAYARAPAAFKRVLGEARDYMGRVLALAWEELDFALTFVDVGRALLRADLELSGGRFHPEILQSLVWREIAA